MASGACRDRSTLLGSIQPRSCGGRSSKARSSARSSRTVKRLGCGSGSARLLRWRTRRASASSSLGLLLGLRREPGQGVQVGDDPAQHPQDAGAVERDELRLRVGLGAEVHDDPLATLQEPQPVAALTEGGRLGRQAGLEVGLALEGAAARPRR